MATLEVIGQKVGEQIQPEAFHAAQTNQSLPLYLAKLASLGLDDWYGRSMVNGRMACIGVDSQSRVSLTDENFIVQLEQNIRGLGNLPDVCDNCNLGPNGTAHQACMVRNTGGIPLEYFGKDEETRILKSTDPNFSPLRVSITEKRILIDEYRDDGPDDEDYHFYARVVEEHLIKFSMRTRTKEGVYHPNLRARELIAQSLKYYSDRDIQGIVGQWRDSEGLNDNFIAYEKLIAQGLSPLEALSQTPSGRIYTSLGFYPDREPQRSDFRYRGETVNEIWSIFTKREIN